MAPLMQPRMTMFNPPTPFNYPTSDALKMLERSISHNDKCVHCDKDIQIADTDTPPAWGKQWDWHKHSGYDGMYQCMVGGQYTGTFATRKEES